MEAMTRQEWKREKRRLWWLKNDWLKQILIKQFKDIPMVFFGKGIH
jgi:fumarate reductase subunit C